MFTLIGWSVLMIFIEILSVGFCYSISKANFYFRRFPEPDLRGSGIMKFPLGAIFIRSKIGFDVNKNEGVKTVKTLPLPGGLVSFDSRAHFGSDALVLVHPGNLIYPVLHYLSTR